MKPAFGRYYPVVIDCETSGCDPNHHGMLELAYSFFEFDAQGKLIPGESETFHILPFEGALFDPESMKIHNIDPYYPLRFAESEQVVLKKLFEIINQKAKKAGYHRSILVGHNAWFDLAFLNAAYQRHGLKSPFHRFTTIDTASLSGLFFKHTVLANGLRNARIHYDSREAHSALYDTQKAAELFCHFWNKIHPPRITS